MLNVYYNQHLWTGNVRELRNLIERLTVNVSEETIGLPVVLESIKPQQPYSILENNKKTLREARIKFEKEYIQRSLAENNGKILETAKCLGIERTHLWKKMKEYNITKSGL